MRMMDILPEHVREWVACMKAGGVSRPTIRYAMVVLGHLHHGAERPGHVTPPVQGVKTPPVPAQPRTILTPEQFAVLYDCPPDARSKLLVETAVESGLRWGEMTELPCAARPSSPGTSAPGRAVDYRRHAGSRAQVDVAARRIRASIFSRPSRAR